MDFPTRSLKLKPLTAQLPEADPQDEQNLGPGKKIRDCVLDEVFKLASKVGEGANLVLLPLSNTTCTRLAF